MPDFATLPYQLVWPFGLALTWMLGEILYARTGLPRISVYGLAGFLFGKAAATYLSPTDAEILLLLANLAFGLILFELGYRINLRWLQSNPWLLLTALVESFGTALVVYLIAISFEVAHLTACLLAAVSMSTSPAAVLRVVNEQGSSGQVTERVLHLSALNCVLAVLTFKVIVGINLFQHSGNLLSASWSSIVLLAVSIALGGLFGTWVPAWLRRMGQVGRDATVTFVVTVAVLVALTHVLKFSPVLAALSFGIVARHKRITLSRTQRNFGVLGDLMAVLLFFFVASTLKWEHVVAGLPLALLLIFARSATKICTVMAFARPSGISLRKGFLTGLALTPMAVFAILLLEQTRRAGVDMVENVAPLAAIALLLEVIGPILTQRALMLARETSSARE